MLTIRKAQLDEFARLSHDNFESRLIAHLGTMPPLRDKASSPDLFAAQVHRAILSGRRFFRTEKLLARYCELLLTQLPAWSGEDHPERALIMLRSVTVDESRRLDNFERWIKTKRK